MTIEQNKTVVKSFVAASIVTDQAAFKEMMSSEFTAQLPDGMQNREEFLQHNNAYNMTFSDREFIVEEQIAEADKVVTRATYHGTHSGVFQGLLPTGMKVSIDAVLIHRVKDGKVVEHWSQFDQLSMMQQLGLIPAD